MKTALFLQQTGSAALLLAGILTAPAQVATLATNSAPAQSSFPVAIHVDAAKPLGELKAIWRMFGADEPNYATMKDGRHEFDPGPTAACSTAW